MCFWTTIPSLKSLKKLWRRLHPTRQWSLEKSHSSIGAIHHGSIKQKLQNAASEWMQKVFTMVEVKAIAICVDSILDSSSSTTSWTSKSFHAMSVYKSKQVLTCVKVMTGTGVLNLVFAFFAISPMTHSCTCKSIRSNMASWSRCWNSKTLSQRCGTLYLIMQSLERSILAWALLLENQDPNPCSRIS